MPQKNVPRNYLPDTYYHVYIHSVAELNQLFINDDADKFMRLLVEYLSAPPLNLNSQYVKKNYCERVKLLAYCLMPNHLHFLLYQNDKSAIEEFMQSVLVSFSMYYNNKHGRRGAVFESRYRASHVDSDSYLQYVSRYIHRNPIVISTKLAEFKYSSYQIYVSRSTVQWLHKDDLLKHFDHNLSAFRDYVEKGSDPIRT